MMVVFEMHNAKKWCLGSGVAPRKKVVMVGSFQVSVGTISSRSPLFSAKRTSEGGCIHIQKCLTRYPCPKWSRAIFGFRAVSGPNGTPHRGRGKPRRNTSKRDPTRCPSSVPRDGHWAPPGAHPGAFRPRLGPFLGTYPPRADNTHHGGRNRTPTPKGVAWGPKTHPGGAEPQRGVSMFGPVSGLGAAYWTRRRTPRAYTLRKRASGATQLQLGGPNQDWV